MVDHARSLLNHFIPDVYIYTDHYKGAEGGASPGYGLSLIASTTEGVLYSAEGAASSGSLPEDLGLAVSQMLCEEISRGGCVDTSHQSLALLFMVLATEDVSKISIGKLSDYTVGYLRLLQDFFGTMFKITPDDESSSLHLSCVGIGFTNVSRKIA
jgi:RNA 3'-terminal phosphate cyclase-like protein